MNYPLLTEAELHAEPSEAHLVASSTPPTEGELSAAAPRERCVQLDFLRTLCVVFVLTHHAEIRLEHVYYTTQFVGYALSENLWVLWYLVIMSGMLFALSARPLGPYLLRMGAILLFGAGCNALGIAVSWYTNPDPPGGRWPMSFGNMLYQMYYVLIVSGFAIFIDPVRLRLLHDRSPHVLSSALSCVAVVALVAFPFWLPLLSSSIHLSRGCQLEYAASYAAAISSTLGVLCALSRGRPELAALAIGVGFASYFVYTGASQCRDDSISGRIPRFVWWYAFGVSWAGFLRARRRQPRVAAAVERFQRCSEAYWLGVIPLFEAGQTSMQRHREPDLLSTQDPLVDWMVATKDVVLIVIFFAVSLMRTTDPCGLAAPLNYWALLAYCSHYAIIYAIPSSAIVAPIDNPGKAFIEMATLGACLASMILFVVVYEVAGRVCRRRGQRAKVQSHDGGTATFTLGAQAP